MEEETKLELGCRAKGDVFLWCLGSFGVSYIADWCIHVIRGHKNKNKNIKPKPFARCYGDHL